MEHVVDLIDRAIQNHTDENALKSIGQEVHELMSHRPLFIA
jgi:glycine/serine hydroxymethyltransferase